MSLLTCWFWGTLLAWKGHLVVLDEAVARYTDMRDQFGEDMAYTVTIPDSGILTIDDAVRRMGYTTTDLQDPDDLPRPSDSISLHQVGAGIVTLDWAFPVPERRQVTDRLGGEGFRHWYVAFDINGYTSMHVRYGGAEGDLEGPEPASGPFTPWTELLGPLSAYVGLFNRCYDSEEADASVDIVAACLAVVEAESGVRLDWELMNSPAPVLSLPNPDFA
ncbi:hypothetical protein SMD20_46360 [Nonomuraea sp. LP-02]|uniref:hypothetical protein n=1 Tax=Nonomuraea sp. LP-02 TaxID=3097960 RepID=UPI002E35C3BA|nr:hypothetical protein [Nonomuraea sp. LP-02]MED7931713.1 hypothetical protein [Nonomuraea sp. LP-02]